MIFAFPTDVNKFYFIFLWLHRMGTNNVQLLLQFPCFALWQNIKGSMNIQERHSLFSTTFN